MDLDIRSAADHDILDGQKIANPLGSRLMENDEIVFVHALTRGKHKRTALLGLLNCPSSLREIQRLVNSEPTTIGRAIQSPLAALATI